MEGEPDGITLHAVDEKLLRAGSLTIIFRSQEARARERERERVCVCFYFRVRRIEVGKALFQ